MLVARRLSDSDAWKNVRRSLVDRPRPGTVVLTASNVPDDAPTGVRFIRLADVLQTDGGLAIDLETLSRRIDRSPRVADEPVVLIGDGHEVWLHGEVFRFPRGERQRRIVQAIHEALLAGEPMTSWARIAENLDLPAGVRLRDYFKKHRPPVLGRLLKEVDGMVGFCLRG